MRLDNFISDILFNIVGKMKNNDFSTCHVDNFGKWNIEIDNYNDYTPKYAVVDYDNYIIRLTDDYEELDVATMEDLPVFDFINRKFIRGNIL